MTGFKTCSKCRLCLPLTEFHKRRKSENVYRSACIHCERGVCKRPYRPYGRKQVRTGVTQGRIRTKVMVSEGFVL